AAARAGESSVSQPDVVLRDLGWDASVEALDLLRDGVNDLGDPEARGVPVLVLLNETDGASEVWSAGVRGMLQRDAGPDRVAAALKAAEAGLVALDPLFTAGLMPTGQAPDDGPPIEALTPREHEVLQLLAEGLPNKAIARRLNISEHTVKFHVNAILGKLAASSRTEAVVRATRAGLIVL
ncbi:MAG: LuxR C-terminal-related transcriptional regulator, partial [Anaerolineae bacterium]